MKLPHNIPSNAYLINNANSVELTAILTLIYFINRTKNFFVTTHA